MRSGYSLHAARTIYEDAPAAPWISAALNLKPASQSPRGQRSEPPARARTTFFPAGLTSREVDVLRLVARGRTNYQIANDLTISLHTVTRHLTHIYNKAGVTNRAEAAAYAFRHGLEDDLDGQN
jgi:DNA-binding NarL/FixJ family response regulator